MLEAVLAILLMSMASHGLVMPSALQFNQLEAKQVANEAEQYAMNEVEYLRQVGFDDLDEALHDRKSNLEFSGVDGWESVTSFVTEKAVDDDRSIKIAKVEVYKEGENIPRYSMEVPLPSQGNNSKFIPDYTKGKRINSGFVAPCNGVIVALTGANTTGDPAYGSAYLNVNNIEVLYWKYEQHGENKVPSSILVKRGDIITYGDYTSWWGYRPVSWIVSFYPCK